MVCHFHGRYKSAIEQKFLEQAEEEITKFCNSCGLRDNSVLVFPPLDAHYRFLIHQLVGESSRQCQLGRGDREGLWSTSPLKGILSVLLFR